MVDETGIRSIVRACFIPHIPFGLVYGGSEVQAERTKSALERRGNSVQWLSMSDCNQGGNIDLYHFFGAGAHFAWWAGVARQHHPVVVSSTFYEGQVARALYYWSCRRVRATRASQIRRVLEVATLVLPNSISEARQLRTIFAVPQSRIRVIPNGVDTDFLGTRPDEFRSLWLRDLPSSEPFVLSVGRIERRKNTLNLLKACVSLGVPAVLVGASNLGDDPKYLQAVYNLAEQHSRSVRLLGPLPRDLLPNAYAAAPVHALASFVETPGLASLEAGLNGCNLVVGACAPVEEYFGDMANVVRHDPASIRNGLERALNEPRDSRHQAEIIREKYSWDRVAELTEEAYLLALTLASAS